MHRACRTTLTVVVALVAIAHAGRAQAIAAACKPLTDALGKEIAAPHHLYQTSADPRDGGKANTHEMVFVGGVTYIEVDGKWKRSPITPAQLLQQFQDNLRTNKISDCRDLGDELANGVLAVVYSAHTQSESGATEVKAWIGKTNGLPLREEITRDVEGTTGKMRMTIRYEYNNVQAPPGAK